MSSEERCGINDLPDEMLLKVLKYLDIKNLGNCRSVSKRFRQWIDTIKLDELVIIKRYRYPVANHRNERWFDTFHDVDKKSVISWFDLDVLENLYFDLSGLRRLKIDIKIEDEFDLDFIQELIEPMDRLYHLELNCDSNKDAKLKLPKNVKNFSIKFFSEIEINCDSLETFGFKNSGYSKIKISNPIGLINLHVRSRVDYDNLANFKHVKTIHINQPDDSVIMKILEDFTNLKSFYYYRDDYHDDMDEVMSDLLSTKESINSDVDFYYDGALLDEEYIEEYKNEQLEYEAYSAMYD